jgi:3-methylcrotonyl-CoA carboxylase alpha subunit
MGATSVTRIAPGAYRVEQDGRAEIVYVAGSAGDRWAFWNGAVFHGELGERPSLRVHARGARPQSLFAPMPATVVKVLVQPGTAVKKGHAVVLLEAMKMELPVRAPTDAVVAAVHCREGELVQAGALLVDLQ